MDIDAGKRLNSDLLAPDVSVAVDLGYASTRVIVEETVQGQDRKSGEITWEIDPRSWCADAEAPVHFSLAADGDHTYLSVVCDSTDEVHLAVLSGGSVKWESKFTAANGTAPNCC